MITASHITYESYEFSDNFGSRWRVQPSGRILGPSVTCTGRCAEDVKAATQQIFACFWRNSRFLTNSGIPIQKRLQKLHDVAGGIIRARAASWPPCQATEIYLDRRQAKLVAWMLRLRCEPNETAKQFCLRRNRAVKQVASTQWSKVHLYACLSWRSHLQRHPDSWAARAASEQDHDWVSSHRRVWMSASGRSSKTFSRGGRGKVHRWDQSGWTSRFNPDGARDPRILWKLARELLQSLGCKDRSG